VYIREIGFNVGVLDLPSCRDLGRFCRSNINECDYPNISIEIVPSVTAVKLVRNLYASLYIGVYFAYAKKNVPQITCVYITGNYR